MIGREVGPYRFLEEIGQGGMGIVYKAVHTQIEQEVAIKVLRPEYVQDPSMRRRFIAEAKLQAKLSHPHVVNIFNYLEDEGHILLVMERVKGPTLEQRLARTGHMAAPEAVAICRDVLAALSFMHSRGIIHRDIKPANIMFTETGVVKVTDFGIAKVTGEKGQTRTSMHIGTLCYMSPEQIQGRPVSAASDLYALGITLYQMVTGDLPFNGDSEYTIMRAHIEEAPEPPWAIDPRISGGLGQVILRALEKKPEHRYTDAKDFSEALAGVAPQPSTAEPAVRSAFRPPSRMHAFLQCKSLACLTAVAALSAVLAIWLYPVFYNGSGPIIPSISIAADPPPSDVQSEAVAENNPLPSPPILPPPLHPEPLREPPRLESRTEPEISPFEASFERIRFYEGGKELTPVEQRIYSAHFEMSPARYIYAELSFVYPALGRFVAMSVSCTNFRPDGTTAQISRTETIQPPSTRSWHSLGWGSETPGLWKPGTYRVECRAEGRAIAESEFEVVPSALKVDPTRLAVEAPSVLEPPGRIPHISQEPDQDEPSQESKTAKRVARRPPRTNVGSAGEYRNAASSQPTSPTRTQRDADGWYIKK